MASQKLDFDSGETRHVRIEVLPQNTDKQIPFRIRTARWELLDENESLEDEGECVIEDHELDAYISPNKTESYTLKFTYEVADEIWIDKIRVVVS